MALSNAWSPFILTCKNISVSLVPIPNTPFSFCGLLKPISPVSCKGFTEIIVAPLDLAFLQSRQHTRVIGSWVLTDNHNHFCFVKIFQLYRSFANTNSLCQCKGGRSWHILEQSGKLLVPYSFANNWYRKAASLLVRPEV